MAAFFGASHEVVHAAPVACPSNLPGSVAFASPDGLILCRSGDPPVIVTQRTDATAIAFTRGANWLQFRSGGALHVYDIARCQENIVPDYAPYCPEPLPMCTRSQRTPDGRWLLHAKEGQALPNGLPGPATLLASNGALLVQVHASDGDDLDLAGVAPGGGTALFWIDPQHSASLMSDTVPLGMIALSAVRHNITVQLPRIVPSVVALFPITGYPLRDWISFAPNGSAFAAIAGETREVFYSEHLVRCTVREAQCEQWNHKPGFVELDPAMSPSAEYVAFVRAVELHAGDGPSTIAAWQTWSNTRQLVLAATNPSKSPVTVSEAGGDVSSPTWITANRLLFISHDRLREFDLNSRRIRYLANLADRGIGYYGYVARSDRFAWATNGRTPDRISRQCRVSHAPLRDRCALKSDPKVTRLARAPGLR